jgi:xanthine dehydrogenase small subunit
MERLRFNLNGEWVEESTLPPTTTLLRYLRDVKGLTGTKEGCAEGDCGACTVAVVETAPSGEPVWRAVNSCLVLLPMVQGKHVITVEGLAREGRLHPSQVAMAEALASQCGYCTPGVVMTVFEASQRTDLDAPWKLDDQLAGNLCRCTGYRPIRDAAKAVAGQCTQDAFAKALPESKPSSMELTYEARGQRYVTPTSFEALFAALDQHPDARFVAGGTDLSLEVTKRYAAPPKLISLEGLSELKALTATGDGFRLGATATIAELEAFCEKALPPVHRMTRYFGARQVKHRGTLGGNLCNASPIGDLAPVLLSLDAVAVLKDRHGERKVPLEDFFTGYRKTALRAKELLAAVEVPRLDPQAKALAYKVSKRRELDISAVSAGLFVTLDEEQRVTAARFGYGGMAATPKRARKAEAALMGRTWKKESVELAVQAMEGDFTPMTDHRGSSAWRALVAKNLLRGLFEETQAVPQPPLAFHHAATVQRPEEVSRG